MATGKRKVSVYISQNVVAAMERLGVVRDRSLSNLTEVVFKAEIEKAIESGELEPPPSDDLLLRQLSDRTGLAPGDILRAIEEFKDSHLCGGG